MPAGLGTDSRMTQTEQTNDRVPDVKSLKGWDLSSNRGLGCRQLIHSPSNQRTRTWVRWALLAGSREMVEVESSTGNREMVEVETFSRKQGDGGGEP